MGKLSFGSTGLSYEVKKVDLSSRSAPKCPRCGNTVYFNEEKKALGKSWHTKCFSCVMCKKSLDSTNANGHEGEIYCNACHRREFGPRGYGYAGGASGLSTETSTMDILLGRSRHSSSSSASSPKSPKSPTERPWSQFSTLPHQHHQQNGTERQLKLNPAPPPRVIDRNNIECCPRCGRRVYFAEEVKALKRKWHKQCFKCAQCDKMLDAGRCTSHQGEVYCQACYSRCFGPQGYGYGSHRVGNNNSYRVYKSATLPARASARSAYLHNGDTGVRSDMNGTKREWTDHAEDIQYMKQLAAELDQFE